MKYIMTLLLLVSMAATVHAREYRRITAESATAINGDTTNILQDVVVDLYGKSATNSAWIGSLSNAHVELQGVVNVNAKLGNTNALIANLNEGMISNNINMLAYSIYQSFSSIPGVTLSSTNFGWTYSWLPEDENYTYSTSSISPSPVDFGEAITNYVGAGDATNYYYIGINSQAVESINANFTAVSNDFVSLTNFLVGPVTGLVYVLQDNQNITTSNFTKVNYNSTVWSNAIKTLADEVADSINPGATATVSMPYAEMDVTNYTAVPTGLTITFPSMVETINGLAQTQVEDRAPGVVVSNVGLQSIAASTTYLSEGITGSDANVTKTLFGLSGKWYSQSFDFVTPGFYVVNGWWVNSLGSSNWLVEPTCVYSGPGATEPIVYMGGTPYVPPTTITLARNVDGYVTNVYTGPAGSQGSISFVGYTSDGTFTFFSRFAQDTTTYGTYGASLALQVNGYRLELREE